MIFVNLAVKDLERSRRFFGSLGYTFNPQFSDENAACLVISDTIYAMLLKEAFFRSFTPKELVDATTATEAILTLSVDSRAEVDELADKALAAGGSAARDPEDQDYMYTRSFQDPDGHIWEVFHMDEEAARRAAEEG